MSQPNTPDNTSDDPAPAGSDTVLSVPAYPARTVDPTGAGESFAGAFLAACLTGDLITGPADSVADGLRRAGAVAAVVAALVALKLLKTNVPMGVLALGGAGWWVWFGRGGRKSTGMSRAEASRLLDVSINAAPDEVRAAHRRLVARVHPDVGGSADLTQQVNAARDAMLQRST